MPATFRRTGTWKSRSAAGAAVAALLFLSACSAGDVLSMRPSLDLGRGEPENAVQEAARSEPITASYPPFVDPAASPAAGVSTEEADCRRELRRLDVAFQDVAPVGEGGQCGIEAPVSVSRIGSVEMKPAATLTCRMALTFARWTRKELVPAARWRYWTGVQAIRQGSSYSCRDIRGTRTVSEHAKGNALDVMSIELSNGDAIDVKKPGFFSFWKRGFLNNVRTDGCSYFTTVLGPGYNYDHRNHFHFDIKERRSGRTACY